MYNLYQCKYQTLALVRVRVSAFPFRVCDACKLYVKLPVCVATMQNIWKNNAVRVWCTDITGVSETEPWKWHAAGQASLCDLIVCRGTYLMWCPSLYFIKTKNYKNMYRIVPFVLITLKLYIHCDCATSGMRNSRRGNSNQNPIIFFLNALILFCFMIVVVILVRHPFPMRK